MTRKAPGRADMDCMSTDTITIIVAIIGTGAGLALAIVPGLRDLRRSVGDLGERVSRLEGFLYGLNLNGSVGGRRITATDEMPKSMQNDKPSAQD